MAKVKLKRFWIVYEDNVKAVKELTWKQLESYPKATSFYWDNADSAERYLDYLNTKRIEA